MYVCIMIYIILDISYISISWICKRIPIELKVTMNWYQPIIILRLDIGTTRNYIISRSCNGIVKHQQQASWKKKKVLEQLKRKYTSNILSHLQRIGIYVFWIKQSLLRSWKNLLSLLYYLIKFSTGKILQAGLLCVFPLSKRGQYRSLCYCLQIHLGCHRLICNGNIFTPGSLRLKFHSSLR